MVHADRRRGRSRTRVLYWFRTPPGVRVGRSALDEDAIRHIEEHNPGVAFDWTRILKGEGAVTEQKPRTDQPERRARPRGRDAQAGAPAEAPRRVESRPPTPVPVSEVTSAVEEDHAPQPVETAPVAAFDDDGTPVAELPPAPRAEPLDPTAALARLGAEGLLRLRARHAEVLARISEKLPDPAVRDELKAQAERLNPDNWVTDADVTEGLEQYEAVFESLRSVVGRGRKRRRRRGGSGGGAAGDSASPAEPGGGDAAVPAADTAEDDGDSGQDL